MSVREATIESIRKEPEYNSSTVVIVEDGLATMEKLVDGTRLIIADLDGEEPCIQFMHGYYPALYKELQKHNVYAVTCMETSELYKVLHVTRSTPDNLEILLRSETESIYLQDYSADDYRYDKNTGYYTDKDGRYHYLVLYGYPL